MCHSGRPRKSGPGFPARHSATMESRGGAPSSLPHPHSGVCVHACVCICVRVCVMSASLPRPIYLFVLKFSKATLEKIENCLHAILSGFQMGLRVKGTKYAVLICNNNNYISSYYYYHELHQQHEQQAHTRAGRITVGAQNACPAVISFRLLPAIRGGQMPWDPSWGREGAA